MNAATKACLDWIADWTECPEEGRPWDNPGKEHADTSEVEAGQKRVPADRSVGGSAPAAGGDRFGSTGGNVIGGDGDADEGEDDDPGPSVDERIRRAEKEAEDRVVAELEKRVQDEVGGAPATTDAEQPKAEIIHPDAGKDVPDADPATETPAKHPADPNDAHSADSAPASP